MLGRDVEYCSQHVLKLLYQNGRLGVEEVKKLTGRNDFFIYLVLGWLLKENKIEFFDQKGSLFIESKNVLNEIYY